MKYLVLILVIVLVLALVRAKRPAPPPVGGQPPPPPPAPRDMVACRHCGVHLPRDEALPGPGGAYCSEGHRRAAQD